jgi:putative ribosome biogenesis GTPase RsgA
VTKAVKDGLVEPTRYDSYLRLYEKASQIKTWEIKQEPK